MKQTSIKIMAGATGALGIPLLGNMFVEGWNWSWHDFVFAWVFWLVTALTVYGVVQRCAKYKVTTGFLVGMCFVVIWVILATG